MSRKELVLSAASDAAKKFMYYDRKEDEELPRGEIEAALGNGEVTIDEIVKTFRKGLL